MSKAAKQYPPRQVIGIGSPHGDDRAGWVVTDQLLEKFASAANLERAGSLEFHKAAVPHDVLDWLSADAIVHIIDASVDIAADVRCYAVTGQTNKLSIRELPLNHLQATQCPEVVCQLPLRSNSTHHFDLLAALELALTLGRLPKIVLLWTISISQTNTAAALSSSTQELVQRCARYITESLYHGIAESGC